ncbi:MULTISPECIES: site-specific integrase [unclassified Marinobacterium]|uniref:tyrosine-type recombinase/integrase n=1 Tax=unclassified Marinobacterium TaxID=2644139 RepID=UPI001568CD1C|nr:MULTISPECIES: site-specific integrase [unclassified Marinobacterium]NRP52387.1 site-specific tyrosine recombinase XerC [Marinobacterium sp. xm-v-242]NRP76968.1 site-specific tyrosine recombinase XerC [Marinobacterium sp. xm-m-383]
MGRKKIPGLIKRAGVWHIDKQISGRRICRSTGTDQLVEAEKLLARVIEEARQAEIYGVRPERSFEQAAAKYVLENTHKRSLKNDISRLKQLMPWIGDTSISRLNLGSLQPWIDHRRAEGAAAGTINHGLKVVRRILNLAAHEWVDEYGLSWLLTAPRIKLLPDVDKRQPYPLSWDEQEKLFEALPKHLKQMALFTVNTGCRDAEVCNLRWDWEVQVPQLKTSVFIIPSEHVKNGDERLIVLNDVAKSVVEEQRGLNNTYVFPYQDRPVQRMLNGAWLRARKSVGLDMVRVHDLKHTFGRRLRAAGVSFEDRQDLLGHRSGRITTHYSAAELTSLIEAANKVCSKSDKPDLVVMRRLRLVG